MTLFNIGVRDIKMVWADKGFPNFCSVEIRTSSPHFRVDDKEEENPENETDEKNLNQTVLDGNQSGIPMLKIGLNPEDAQKQKDENLGETMKNSDFCKLRPTQREEILKMEEKAYGLLMTDKLPVIEHGVTFDNRTEKSRVMKIGLRVPLNKAICPVLEVFMYHYPLGIKSLFACGSYDLSDTLGWFYGTEDDEEYKLRWNKFFKINQKKGEEEKDKPVKIKVPKVKAENQLLFMDDLIYELPAAGNFQSKRAQKQQYRREKEMREHQALAEEESENLAEEGQPEGSEESFVKYYKVITEKLGEADLEHLDEGERRKVVEELYNRGYFQDWELNEEEVANPANQAVTNQQSGPNLYGTVSVMGGGLGLSKPMNTLHATSSAHPNPKFKGASNLADSQTPEAGKEEKVEDFNLDLADKPDSEDNKAEYVQNLELEDEDEIQNLVAEVSNKGLKYDELFVAPTAEARKVEAAYRAKKAKKGMLSFFSFKAGLGWLFKKEKPIEYMDYDTDEEEDTSDVPPYLKGRKEYQTDLEDALWKYSKSKVIQKFPLYRGSQRGKMSIFGDDRNVMTYDNVAEFKCVFIREDNKELVSLSKIRGFLTQQLKERPYTLRVYILKGVSIVPLDGSDDSEITIDLALNDIKGTEIKSLKANENGHVGKNPEFYNTYEFLNVKIPGSAILKIDVKKKTVIGDGYIGSTQVDLEERVFMPEWNIFDKKPVEKRNIEHPSRGSRGRLEMWIDILKPSQKEPATVIFPKVQIPYELRVIVWEAKDCVFKDATTESNDLFARGTVKNKDEKWQETDTHWFCRAVGSFNWRWKWEIKLPVDMNKNYGEDRFTIQLWDRDLIGSNELIGEAEIDLHQHKMLSKAYVRNKNVEMKKKIVGTGEETKLIWFDVYHPEVIDEDGNKISQGKVLMSFEAVPNHLVEKLGNAVGRENPNFYPTLPDPVGRFVFDITSPLKMLKTIIGPKLYYKICFAIFCTIFLGILVAVGYYVVPNVLGNKVSDIIK